MNDYRKKVAEEAYSWLIVGIGVWAFFALVVRG